MLGTTLLNCIVYPDQQQYTNYIMTTRTFSTILAIAMIGTMSCRQVSVNQTAHEIYATHEHDAMPAKYDISRFEKMRWLGGSWNAVTNGVKTNLSIHIGQDNSLVAHRSSSDALANTQALFWQNEKYYFGADREWVVTWIGDKDIRFDAAKPGVFAMTWTKKNDGEWCMIQHTPNGDQLTLFSKCTAQP